MKAVKIFYHQLLEQQKGLLTVGWLNLFLGLCCFVLMGFDDRIVTGVNVWLKPLKFAFSLAIFSWTIAWLLTIYPYSTIWKKRIAKGFSIFILIEIMVLITQAARGELSHYNTSSTFNSMMFILMGIGIYSMMSMMLLMALHSFTKPLDTIKPIVWVLRFAWLTMILAFFGGQMMIIAGQHSVGVADGGEGIPFVNWSKEGGDLRVMHFFGLHGIQILPIILGFIWQGGGKKNPKNLSKVAIFLGITYFVFVAFVFWQALRQVPFIS